MEQQTAGTPKKIRLRYAQTSLLVLLVLMVCAAPIAFATRPWGALIFLPILLGIVLLYRVGADITPTDVVIRGPLYTRRVPRADLAGLTVTAERYVSLLRTDGSTIALPTARPRDLPRLRRYLFGVAEDEIDLAEDGRAEGADRTDSDGEPG